MPNTRAGDAFISMLAGYQLYKPKSYNNKPLFRRIRTARTTTGQDYDIANYYIKNKEGGSFRQTSKYVGNINLIKYTTPVGTVGSETAIEARSKLSSPMYGGADILSNILNQLYPQAIKAGDTVPIDAKITSPAEQPIGIFSERDSRPSQAHPLGARYADPIDIKYNNKHYQVTFTALDATREHHGIHGVGRKDMLKTFKDIDNLDKSKRAKDNMKGKEALNYFKSSVVGWNRVLRKLQRQPKMNKYTGEHLRRDIKTLTSKGSPTQNFSIVSREGLKGANRRVSTEFTKEAGRIARTLLSDFNFAKSTVYTFPLSKNNPYVYVHIYNFRMTRNLQGFQFDTGALQHSKIVYGHTELSNEIALNSNTSEYNVAGNQFAAQMAARAKVASKDITIGQITATNAAKTVASGYSNVFPSIDILAADKQLSKWLKTSGMKRIEKEFKSFANTYKGQQHIPDYKPLEAKNTTFWAMPYISFADYDIERFG